MLVEDLRCLFADIAKDGKKFGQPNKDYRIKLYSCLGKENNQQVN